jgi:hypothetical protein
MFSMAQPSLPGKSSRRRPGNRSHNSGAVSALLLYSIFGRMKGGSYTVSFSSGDDRSIMRLGSFMWRLALGYGLAPLAGFCV